jgi:hypothetical protein
MNLQAAGKEAIHRVQALHPPPPPPPPEPEVFWTKRGLHAFLLTSGGSTFGLLLLVYNTGLIGFSQALFLIVAMSLFAAIAGVMMGGYVGDDIAADFDRGSPLVNTKRACIAGLVVGGLLTLLFLA